MKNNILAIIPARGGSKRIPRKNIKFFLEQPIIKYSIDAAIQSGCFDEVMVSTEDHEIAEVARSFGAVVPFFRSTETANDYAMLADVIEEVLIEYEKSGKKFEYCCCILATAPFVTPEILRKGFEMLCTTGADSVLPVTKFSCPIQRSVKIENEKLIMFWPENYNVRSQDLEAAYHDCGQFYWLKVSTFKVKRRLYTDHTMPIVVSETQEQDIDNEEDWKIAELKYRMLHRICL